MKCLCGKTGWRPRLASTHTRRWRFSGPVPDVLCKSPFAELVAKCRARWKRPLPDNCRRLWNTAAERPHFKTVTVRERPILLKYSTFERYELAESVQRKGNR
jgi:hypothetical protein